MRQSLSSVLCTLALGAFLSVSAYAGEAIKEADLPAPVKSAMEKAAHGAALTGIEKTTNAEGKTVYSASYMKKDKPTEITVDEAGHVVKKGHEGKDKKKK